jgi:small subunit ribosomal protein S6
MSTDFKRTRDYELMVIFHPELSEEDLVSEGGKVEAHITGAAGAIRLVNREAPWGRRRLAYPIRHGSRDIRDGVYVLYYFTAESGKIEEIEREIKLQDRVIRYLLTQQTAPLMEPTPAEGEVAEEAAEGEATEAAQPAATVSTAEGEAATETAEQATETAEPATETAEQASDTEAPVE